MSKDNPLLQELKKSLATAIHGEGQMRIIRGPFGIGKTYVLNEFISSLEAQDIPLLQVKPSEEYGTGITPFLDALIEYYEKHTGLAAKAIVKTIIGKTLDKSPLGSILVDISKIDVPEIALKRLHEHFASEDLLIYYAYFDLITRLMGKKTLVIAVEDIQWLDSEGLKLLAFLRDKIKKKKVLLIATYRSAYITNNREENAQSFISNFELKNYCNVRCLDVTTFSEPKTKNMATAMLDKKILLTDIEAKILYSNCKGNPFYLKMLLLLLVEENILVNDGNGYSCKEFEKIDSIVPKTVEGIIVSRLRKLYSDIPEAKNTLQYAAAMGERFSINPLSRILEEKISVLLDRLKLIEFQYSLVRELDIAPLFEFDHQKTQQVIYAQLGLQLSAIHQQIAFSLEEMGFEDYRILAHHYIKGGRLDKGALYLYRSIDKFWEIGLYESGVLTCRDYLNLVASKDVTVDRTEADRVRFKLGRFYYKMGRYDSAVSMLKGCLGRKNLPADERIIAEKILGLTLSRMSTRALHDEGIRHLENALKAAKGMEDEGLIGEVYIALAPAYDKIELYPESKVAYTTGIKYLREAMLKAKNNDRKLKYEILLAEAMRKSCMFFSPTVSLDLMQASVKIFDKHSISIEKAKALNNIGTEYLYIGNLEMAEETLLNSVQEFRDLGGIDMDKPLNNIGLVMLARDEYHRAMNYFLEAQGNMQEESHTIFITMNIATTYRKLGQVDVALDLMSHLEERVLSYQESYHSDYFYFNLGMTYFSKGEFKKCIEYLEKVPPHTFRDDMNLILAKRYMHLILAYERLGNTKDAEEIRDKMKRQNKTQKPQKWYYSVDYYPCDMEFWSS